MISPLTKWLDRPEQMSDVISAGPTARLAATLDRDTTAWEAGTPLPELWHWLYFLPAHPQREIGPDGHVRRGGFLPPVPLPRRMWAGGRFGFLAPLRIGDTVLRTSRIVDISEKHGRSGALVFVRVQHEIARDVGLALTEVHDIVYRDSPGLDAPGAAPEPAPTDEAFARTVEPTPVLLYRYSALTFNGHRIHYDRDYCREVEGYPGLVVHGPLIATLMVELLHCERPAARLRSFAFKAVRPLFDVATFEVCGRFDSDGQTAHLWARDHEGHLAMDARAQLA